MRIEDSLNKYASILNPQAAGGQQQKQNINGIGQQPQQSFAEIFQQKLQSTSELNFSKHAMQRLEQRDIELSGDDLNKISDAVKKAEQKGVANTLVLSSKGAFIVNVGNNTVITAMNSDDMKENIFTQIDGAVII